MKIKQNESEIIITNSGVGMVALGLIFASIGFGMAYLAFAGKMATEQGETPLWMSLLFSLAFLGAGAAALYSAISKKIVLSKVGESYFEAKRILGGRTGRQSFQLSDIAEVRLTSGFNGSSNGRPTKKTTLQLILKDASEIEVGSSNGDGGINVNGIPVGAFMKAPLRKEAEGIAQFVGVQVQVIDMTLGGMVGAMRDVIATNMQPKQSPDFMQQPSQPAPIAPITQTQPVVNTQAPNVTPLTTIPPVQPPVAGQVPPVEPPKQQQ